MVVKIHLCTHPSILLLLSPWRKRQQPAQAVPRGQSQWSISLSKCPPRRVTPHHQRLQTPPARWRKYSVWINKNKKNNTIVKADIYSKWAHINCPVVFLPGRWHSLRADTCGLPTCSGTLRPEQHCAPGTEQPRRGCSSLSVFQPCSEATSAAGLGMSGNPLQSWRKSWQQQDRHKHESTKKQIMMITDDQQ